MTRTMYDAVNVNAGIPDDAQLVAGYIDGFYQSFAGLAARFPNAVHVPIAVWPSTNDGLVLDVETGDASPEQAPPWVLMRRAAGVDPSVYCSESVWPQVRAAFQSRGIPEPHYWIAAYPGPGPVLYPDSVAHQYGGDPDLGWDISVVADFWPGVDSSQPPTPPAPPTPEDDDMAQLKAVRVIYFHPGNAGNGGQLALLEDADHGRYSVWLRSTPMLFAFDLGGGVDGTGGGPEHYVGDEVFETFPPGRGSYDPRTGKIVKKWEA